MLMGVGGEGEEDVIVFVCSRVERISYVIMVSYLIACTACSSITRERRANSTSSIQSLHVLWRARTYVAKKSLHQQEHIRMVPALMPQDREAIQTATHSSMRRPGVQSVSSMVHDRQASFQSDRGPYQVDSSSSASMSSNSSA